MCINLSWNNPGPRCQHDTARDASFLEQYGEALQEEFIARSANTGEDIMGISLAPTTRSNSINLHEPRHTKPIMRALTTAAFLVAGLFVAAQSPAASQAITLAKEGALVVDVREPDELAQLAYDAPNVVNIPLGDITKRTGEIPKDKPVVVVCRSGGRSAQAVEELKKLGYTNATSLEGGIYAWQEAGMPVKKGGTAAAGCCAGGKADKNCTPEQVKSGCCSGAPKAAAPAPADKSTNKK